MSSRSNVPTLTCVSAQPMTTPGSHTSDQASGLTGSGSTSPALALV